MYLEKFFAFGSGPIDRLIIEPQFTEQGLPKPLVLVGRNGAGKTNALSIIADGLIELAATSFQDIMPLNSSGGRFFYRLVGGAATRSGSSGELTALRFREADQILLTRSKAGHIPLDVIRQLVPDLEPIFNWSAEGNLKDTVVADANIEAIFRQGAYVHFPAGRVETPHWAGHAREMEEVRFPMNLSDRLRKPIIATNVLEDLKSWIIDVLFDALLDSQTVLNSLGGGNPIRDTVALALKAQANIPPLVAINTLLRIITGLPNARVVRGGRTQMERKLQVFDGASVAFPTLNAFSSGQAALFTIFSTILRYGDQGVARGRPEEITGVIIVDEIDAQMHADLQYEAIPLLMKMFPKVQFILTAHSPLLPLGLERLYGEEGVVLVELPTGLRITAERYAEFLNSFEYFKATKAFESEIANSFLNRKRPTIVCEGETDPVYLRTAAVSLGFKALAEGADFDWIGTTSPSGASDGGKDRLLQAVKFLKNNPAFVSKATVLLFDSDAKVEREDVGDLHVYKMRINEQNTVCRSGIENLLPNNVFHDEFYEVVERVTADITVIKKLKKKELLQSICERQNDQSIFEAFREDLTVIADKLNLLDQA